MSGTDSVQQCGKGVVLYICEETRQLVAVPALCHRWDCPTCGPLRLRLAKAKAAAGKPERLITLTTRPRDGLSLEASIKWIRDRWKRLLERLRRNYPRLEYMAFVELHKNGWPHMHILTRGCYIPHKTLKAFWSDLTGSYIVYIQQISNDWQGVQEATKYYLKTARQVHEAAPRLPVYTMSRSWLPPEWSEDQRPAGSWAFYCYVRMPWNAFVEELSFLGLSLAPVPDDPGRFFVNYTGPPDEDVLQQNYDLGTFQEQNLSAALDAFYREYLLAGRDVAHVQAAQDYYSTPA